jgi:hypothetical protein
MKNIIIVLIFILGMLTPLSAQDENYCHDKNTWKEWDILVQKYPHDMDVQMLHAVRLGFCKKIKDGTITFEVAKKAFNHLHETVIKKAKSEQNHYLKNKQL